MINRLQELIAEKAGTLGDQVARVRKEYVESAREAALGSADALKGFKTPVRVVARSGIKLTAVSQAAVQGLIELQSDMLTAAIGEVASRLERASRAQNPAQLVREQVGMIPATRARVAEDAQRAARIFKDAGREVRSVASHAFQRVVETTDDGAPEAGTTARKTARKTGRKTARKPARKTKARARRAA